MTVRELIAELQKLNPDAMVVTNECEATARHENISEVYTVSLVADGCVFVGTGEARCSN